jgi:bifunctional non-homologous end joining protein LigD
MPVKQQFTVENRVLSVTNLDKVLYPAAGFTKRDVIDYYTRVSKWLLPHLKDRPVTLKRFPDGVGGQAFYEKNAPRFTPDWVQTVSAPRREGGKDIRYIVINDLPTLVWCANLASLELHPFLHLASDLDMPTSIVFDLDPGEGATTASCAEVAILLRDVLDRLELQSFAKVSGSKGIQMYVPLNVPVSYASTREFAHSLAQLLEHEHPSLIVSDMAKNLRRGKVFIDWSQNSDFKTTVSVYSLRAKAERPFVSLPATWEELGSLRKKADQLCLEPEAALKRLQKKGDLFEPVLRLKQKLPKTLNGSKPLETYRKKRDFTKTKEPPPAAAPPAIPGKQRRFVIQKHAASHLHYDFRLEMDGVLKSWAIPKGVPYALKERRLAVPTEDHPIAYLDFEGTIPEAQYGGGTVMVWDIGTYHLIDGSYDQGKLHFFLQGKKLNGEWVLVTWGKDRKKCFMLKAGAAAKAPTAAQEDSSALTRRSMAQIASSGTAKVRRGSA